MVKARIHQTSSTYLFLSMLFTLCHAAHFFSLHHGCTIQRWCFLSTKQTSSLWCLLSFPSNHHHRGFCYSHCATDAKMFTQQMLRSSRTPFAPFTVILVAITQQLSALFFHLWRFSSFPPYNKTAVFYTIPLFTICCPR